MKFLTLLVILGALTSVRALSQNMVPNPSMETTSPCPSGAGQINYSTGWVSTMNSPDYFHSCGSGSYTTPGPNLGGTQVPFHGSAYSAMVSKFSTSYYREHQGIALTSPLVPGLTYFCSMRVCLTDISNYASDKMGFFFNTSMASSVLNNAQVYTTSIITDKTNWVLVSGSFVATLPYTHVFIGNFYDDANTTLVSVGGGSYNGAYYFVDSIWVTPAVILGVSPVKLHLVSADEEKVNIAWQRTSAEGIRKFIVERSTDEGMTFEEAGEKEVNAWGLYSFSDYPPHSGTAIQYRVRIIDTNGGTSLSNHVMAVLGPSTQNFVCFPTILRSGEPISLTNFSDWKGTLSLSVYDLSGRSVWSQTLPSVHGQELQIPTQGWCRNIYFLKATAGSETWTTKLFLSE